MQQHYLHEHQILLGSPLLSREYALNASLLTLQREAASREVTLLHAHQVEVARKAYEIEKGKIEEEARQAKRLVRERLMAAVDDRRRMLKEEKESGEGGAGESKMKSTDSVDRTLTRNGLTSASRQTLSWTRHPDLMLPESSGTSTLALPAGWHLPEVTLTRAMSRPSAARLVGLPASHRPRIATTRTIMPRAQERIMLAAVLLPLATSPDQNAWKASLPSWDWLACQTCLCCRVV